MAERGAPYGSTKTRDDFLSLLKNVSLLYGDVSLAPFYGFSISQFGRNNVLDLMNVSMYYC